MFFFIAFRADFFYSFFFLDQEKFKIFCCVINDFWRWLTQELILHNFVFHVCQFFFIYCGWRLQIDFTHISDWNDENGSEFVIRKYTWSEYNTRLCSVFLIFFLLLKIECFFSMRVWICIDREASWGHYTPTQLTRTYSQLIPLCEGCSMIYLTPMNKNATQPTF